MKLSNLLSQREALLQRARLANLAFAYAKLGDFADRVSRARLGGDVVLRPVAPEAERYWATLTSLAGRQSVIEEHFSDSDVMDLADILAFISGKREAEVAFRLEDVAGRFLAPLRSELEQAGVEVDSRALPAEEEAGGGGSGAREQRENGG